MPYSKDDDSFREYLDKVNIQEVLLHAGYIRNKRDGLRYPSYVRLDNDGRRIKGDKFIVNPTTNTCYHPPIIKNYNVISLITEHPDMFPEKVTNPYRLVHDVCRSILGLPPAERSQNIAPVREAKPFSLDKYDLKHFDATHADGYRGFYPYFKSRGIDFLTQKTFKDHFVLASKTNENGKTFTSLAFPMRIAGKGDTIVGFEERGRPRMDGSSGYKGMALGSNASEGIWIANLGRKDLTQAKEVFWFESAYDAMAYYQLNRQTHPELKNAVFLSTSGNPTNLQFRGVVMEALEARHHLCFDNDAAGKQFVLNFELAMQRLKTDLPKVSDEMRPYMDSLQNPKDILSGEVDYLPNDLYKAYGKYESAWIELNSMKQGGVSAPDDIKEQGQTAEQAFKAYKQLLSDRLYIGQEQGPLKDLGTYDIPEWAMCLLENGEQEGLTETEIQTCNDFIEKHFPEGYIFSVDWNHPDEFNQDPAFGERNSNALVQRGEPAFLAVKTYRVHFMHPSQREGEPLKELAIVREIPENGCKDWNDLLIQQEEAKQQESQKAQTTQAGLDMDGNGEIELSESDEKKHQVTHSHGR